MFSFLTVHVQLLHGVFGLVDGLLSMDWMCVGFLNGIGYTEMVLLGVIALMLFGSKLPEVARNFGATYRQLRGKVDEFQREFREWDRADYTSNRAKPTAIEEEERSEPKSPKFVPPPEDDDQ